MSQTPCSHNLDVTGRQEEVVESKIYPARHELHLVMSVVLQEAQGTWQF